MGLGEIGAKVRSEALETVKYFFDTDKRYALCDRSNPLDEFRYCSALSAFHNDWDHIGGIPILGFFAGVGRAAYGATKLSIGAVSTVLTGVALLTMKAVNWVAQKAFKKELEEDSLRARITQGCRRGYQGSKAFAKDGGIHLLRGLGETLTYGCHRFFIKEAWKGHLLQKTVDSSPTNEKIKDRMSKIAKNEKAPLYMRYTCIEAGTELLAARRANDRQLLAIEPQYPLEFFRL